LSPNRGSQRLDMDALAARVADLAGAPVTELHPLPGGLSSVTIKARLGGPESRDVVLKVAPPGLEPIGNRDVLRQARVITLLGQVHGVAVPEVLFTDGAPPQMFAMEFVAGESFEPVTSDGPLPSRHDLASRASAAAAMLARLHSVPPAMAGLADEPVGDLLAEVERWERSLGTVDEDLRGRYEECATALKSSLPSPVAPAILHGDWRLGNMLCRDHRVEAVIDWEIWSIGDPRIDLAWFLMSSVWEGNPFATRRPDGMPDRAALLSAYEAATGSRAAGGAWFDALVRFKSVATMGLILKRNRRAERPDPTVERYAPALPLLIETALGMLGRA
jgi:aminoglycoside phosphotransferase (APT) family kinase protein